MATGNQIIPKKSLGQHWLTDKQALEDICLLASLSKDDVVVEIGPGTGNLTKLLLNNSKRVIAIELDQFLSTKLIDQNIENLEVINQDILSFNFNNLPTNYKIVANIPYYLTGKLIRLISETQNRPSLVVLLVQKEIAERMSANVGNLSVLGLISQYFWHVQKGNLITADKFDPPPKVYSQVVVLKPRLDLTLDQQQEQQLFKLIRIGFMSKRKTILNNLASINNLDKTKLKDLLNGIGIDPNTRPQSLTLNDWIKILSKPQLLSL
jgi:16S rRNA (adenine1518-N6/adenine1519-N6)-dimethyltransferase